MKLAATVALLLLAGCMDAPTQPRSDDFFVNINADGPFLIELPLFIDEATPATVWAEALRVSVGNATLTITGDHFVVEGSGAVSLEALNRRTLDCCASAFVRGTWDGAMRPAQTIQVEVAAGFLKSLSIHHEASSCKGDGCDDGAGPGNQVCTYLFDAAAAGLDRGVHQVHVRTDDVQCSAPP